MQEFGGLSCFPARTYLMRLCAWSLLRAVPVVAVVTP